MNHIELLDRARDMIRDFDAIPVALFQRLQDLGDYDAITEITIPEDEAGFNPLHNVLYAAPDCLWDEWISENAQRLYDVCGLRVFHNEETGYMLGIDGAGYSFAEAHWIPLYKMRTGVKED